MSVPDAARDLGKHGSGGAAARPAADERDDAERARERAAVLDLHEGTRPLEPRVGLHAADRADVAGNDIGNVLARLRDDRDVGRDVLEAPSGGSRRSR